ncbi:OmpA family protein [Roseomonas sp. WA12]
MNPLPAALLLLLAAVPALAQPARPQPAFNCIGAEDLEDDVFEIPFATGRDRLTDAARANLAAAAALLKREPDRNACILGHARREGGQQTSVQLAARRARAVKDALGAAGLPDSRLRSEARVAGFSRTTGTTVARSVSIVVMPVAAPRPERAAPERVAPAAPPLREAPPAPPPPAAVPPRESTPPPAPPPAEPPAREVTPPPARPPAEAPARESTPPPPPPGAAPPRETTAPPPAPPAEPRESVAPPVAPAEEAPAAPRRAD